MGNDARSRLDTVGSEAGSDDGTGDDVADIVEGSMALEHAQLEGGVDTADTWNCSSIFATTCTRMVVCIELHDASVPLGDERRAWVAPSQ